MIEGPMAKAKKDGTVFTPGRGTVKSINVNSDGEYRIEVQHGPDAKPSAPGMVSAEPYRWPCTSTVYVTAAQAKQIRVGSEVKIVVEPVGSLRGVR